MNDILEKLLHVVFPPRCLFCDDILVGDGSVCLKCRQTVEWIGEGSCKHCGRSQEYCTCTAQKSFCDGICAVVYYGDLVKRCIARFKFYNRHSMKVPMAEQMVKRIQKIFPDVAFDIATCVPQSRKRNRKRGYNQAQLLLIQVAKRLQMPAETQVLKKIRDTQSQSRLKREERLHNLNGAFVVAQPDKIQGRTILLVDDIMTTGSTLKECANILYGAGAKAVYCSVFARTLPTRGGRSFAQKADSFEIV